jgi:predicted metalloendopeptidase
VAETLRSLDDQGSRYDSKRSLKNWWSEKDLKSGSDEDT